MITTHLANIVTLSRILLIPVVVSFFLQDKLYLTISLFSIAALTDGVDGYLARYLNQTSPLGAWLDPVADKLIVISMFVLLLIDQKSYLFAISIIIIICREVIISALREWMATLGKHHIVKVSMLGKWKTSAQMLAIFLFMLSKLYPHHTTILRAAYSVFYTATALTLISLVDYIWSAFKALRKPIERIKHTA